MKETIVVHRGEVYYAELSPSQGSEQGGTRPVIIVQNELGNKHSPTTIVVPLTSRLSKKPLPTHITYMPEQIGLTAKSVALCEQVRTIDKTRLRQKMGTLSAAALADLDRALLVSLGLA